MSTPTGKPGKPIDPFAHASQDTYERANPEHHPVESDGEPMSLPYAPREPRERASAERHPEEIDHESILSRYAPKRKRAHNRLWPGCRHLGGWRAACTSSRARTSARNIQSAMPSTPTNQISRFTRTVSNTSKQVPPAVMRHPGPQAAGSHPSLDSAGGKRHAAPSRLPATSPRACSRRCQRPSSRQRDVGFSSAALAGARTDAASAHNEVAAPLARRCAHHLVREYRRGSDRILLFRREIGAHPRRLRPDRKWHRSVRKPMRGRRP